MHIKKFQMYYHYIHSEDYVFLGHRHNNWELNVILQGAMEVTSDGEIFKLAAGDAMLIKPNTFHQNRVIGNQNAEMLVAHFCADECQNGAYKLSADAMSIISLFIKEAERRGISNNSVTELTENSKKLLELFISELRRCESAVNKYDEASAQIYRSTVEYMMVHIRENLSIDQLARTSCVCKTTLKKVFRHYTGMGCIRFFGEMKLALAKSMLENGQSCASVSDSLGFSSQAYFSKKYKEFFGVLPSKSQ